MSRLWPRGRGDLRFPTHGVTRQRCAMVSPLLFDALLPARAKGHTCGIAIARKPTVFRALRALTDISKSPTCVVQRRRIRPGASPRNPLHFACLSPRRAAVLANHWVERTFALASGHAETNGLFPARPAQWCARRRFKTPEKPVAGSKTNDRNSHTHGNCTQPDTRRFRSAA